MPDVGMAFELAGAVEVDNGRVGMNESFAFVLSSSTPLALADGLTIGPLTWSYQPSESSYWMNTAASFHSGDCCRAFITWTMNTGSVSGWELPGCASWYLAAFKYETAGRLWAASAL